MKSAFRYFSSFFIRHRNHFIGWFFFIAYEVITVGLIKEKFFSFGHYASYYVFNILLFYAHAYIVMPSSSMKTRDAFWRFPLFTLLELAVYIPILTFTVMHLRKYNIVSIEHIEWSTNYLTNIGYRGVYFIMFATGYYFIMNYVNERKIAEAMERQSLMTTIEKQKIEKDLVSTQYAHLKSQINPHFLFNTLNFIYTNTRKRAPEAAEAILILSEIMRFAIEEVAEDSLSSLDEEVEHIENLISLHQIKADNRLQVILSFDNNQPGSRIVPLILITLVENVFKHGDLTRVDDPALINVVTEPGTILIETRNAINHSAKHSSHHIGISNIRQRLVSEYGADAVLNTTTDQSHFSVRLSIKSTLD